VRGESTCTSSYGPFGGLEYTVMVSTTWAPVRGVSSLSFLQARDSLTVYIIGARRADSVVCSVQCYTVIWRA
jgi:hypothetical protein